MRVSGLDLAALFLVTTTFGHLAGCGDSGGSNFPTPNGGPSSGGVVGQGIDAGSNGDGSSGSFFGGSGSADASSGKPSGAQAGGTSTGGMVFMCAGCIDLNGMCQPGTDDSACGLGSSTCQPCTTFHQTCMNGLCGGGGGGTGSGTGSASGSSSGSGAASGTSTGSGGPKDAGGGD